MAMLVAVLMLAAPIGALVALLRLADHWQARRRHEVERQIALTDALHVRFGALVAPVVRGRPRAWRIAVAVPFERPAVVAGVLATVDEVFARGCYEVVLSRQLASTPMSPSPRRSPLGRESLSWT